jgi:ABC-type branched-subunit amino acid transport system substrate-binding protein
MTPAGPLSPVDRRSFVRAMTACGAAVVCGFDILEAQSSPASALTLGVVLPAAGGFGGLDSTVANGIELGVDEAKRSAALFQKRMNVVRSNFASPHEAGSVAEAAIAKSGATSIVGGGDEAACRAIEDVCALHRVPFLNATSASDKLRRSVCSPFVFHVAGSDAMYASALKVASQDRASAAADCDIVQWSAALEKYGAAQLNDRFRAMAHRDMTGAAWAGWMSVKIIWESFLRAGTPDGKSIADYMNRGTTEFDGHTGSQLSFRSWDHQLRQPLYCVSKRPARTPGVATVRDIPDLARSPRPARELLDLLGDSVAQSRCGTVKK